MNRYAQEKWSWVDGSLRMRMSLFEGLTDADLAFTPGGQNVTLGALFHDSGEVEHAYVESLKTFTQNFDYRNTEAGLDTSVERLKRWLQSLDDEMKTVIEALSDDDLNKNITRPGGFAAPVELQMEIYLQALMIFFGKVTVYFRAMNKPLPQSFQDYIG